MALIIEDGSCKTDANSYIGLADARAYATDRGVTLPADDAVLTAMLINGTDYLESYSRLFVGKPTTNTQALSWPRKYVRVDQDTFFDEHTIPPKLKDAEAQLCIEQTNGVVLFNTSNPAVDGGFVVREKVDVLEVQYSEHISITGDPIMPAVDALLQFLLWNRAALGLRAVRV